MSTENDQGRRFFTTSEVANYCAVTNDGVLKWIKSSKLRAFSTPGGHYRVSAEDFRTFLEKYEIPIDESFFRGGDRQRTVLVVDDEPNIRDIVQRLLKELDSNLRVEEACDGYEAGIKIGSLPLLAVSNSCSNHILENNGTREITSDTQKKGRDRQVRLLLDPEIGPPLPEIGYRLGRRC